MRILLLLLVLAGTAFAESFITTDGKTYTGKVVSLNPDGITLETDSGPRKVLFSRMDPKVAAEYGYDAKAAQTYQAERATKKAADSARQAEAARRDALARAEHKPAEEATQIEEQRIAEIAKRGAAYYKLHIFQVLSDGDYLTRKEAGKVGKNGQTFRVTAAPTGRVDDDKLKGTFFDIGTWNYEAVTGAGSTVRVLSPVASTPLPTDVKPY